MCNFKKIRNFISDKEGYLSIITIKFQFKAWSLLRKIIKRLSPIFFLDEAPWATCTHLTQKTLENGTENPFL